MIDSKHTSPTNPIIELLPWYVNGTLSPSEKAEVDIYLESHPEYREEIELLKKLQNATSDDINIPSPDPSRLMRKLDQLEQAQKVQPATHLLGQFFDRLFTPRAAWAAVPVALVIATVLLLMPSQTSRNGNFQTLSSDETPMALSILVTSTTANATTTLIDQVNKLAPTAKIKTGSDNQLTVIIPEAIEPEAALKLLQNIQSLPAVESAELVSSQ